jgi:hypothetical protein
VKTTTIWLETGLEEFVRMWLMPRISLGGAEDVADGHLRLENAEVAHPPGGVRFTMAASHTRPDGSRERLTDKAIVLQVTGEGPFLIHIVAECRDFSPREMSSVAERWLDELIDDIKIGWAETLKDSGQVEWAWEDAEAKARDAKVKSLWGQGLGNEEIARELDVSKTTVERSIRKQGLKRRRGPDPPTAE